MRIESSENPTSTNAVERTAIANPGGRNHHQAKPRLEVVAFADAETIVPQDTTDGSPKPRKDRAASVRMAPGTESARFA